MNSIKTLSFTTLAALATAIPANAYFYAGFHAYKQYRQYNTAAPTFLYGYAQPFATDGIFTETASCAQNGSTAPFPANPMMGCNIGSNGVLVTYDSSGTPFLPTYHEVVGIESATTMTVGRPDLVSLYSRPVSEYPGTDVFDATTYSLFYDTQSITGDVREYRIGSYYTSRIYTNRSQMEKEVVEGVYTYRFPLINQPNKPLYLNFPVKNTVEGYVTKPLKGGFRFNNLRYNTDGFAQYDWRAPAIISWEGMSPSLIQATDRLYISFNYLDEDDINDAPAGESLFPPGLRARLTSPVLTSYTLPPGFFNPNYLDPRQWLNPPTNTIPNPTFGERIRQKAVVQLTLERGSSSGISVISTRLFELPIIFVNTFAGAMAASFPEGTSSSSMSKTADPDGDGISNWVEWVTGTDPAKANAPTTLSAMSFVPPSMAKDGEPTPGFWEMTVPRSTSLPEGVEPDVESSVDLKNWATIKGDPQWEVINNPEEPFMRVRSKTPELAGKRYFRAKFIDNSIE